MTSRNIVRIPRRIHEEAKPNRRVFRGSLAEDYDGIGQYVAVALSQGSVSSAYKARLNAGDFGTGQIIPKGTPVVVFADHGTLTILSLGAK